MKFRSLVTGFYRFQLTATALHTMALIVCTAGVGAEALTVPNHSFESPEVPPVTPYASPEVGVWQKSEQPPWYDPSRFEDTPWAYLAGQFYNVPFPEQHIDNCDGAQAAFLFAVPEVALFQDYDSITDTNGTPNHAFDAVYSVGRVYELTLGLIGGGGNMAEGVTLEFGLYYRDAASNRVNVVSTSVTNTPVLFPTNTHFVDFQARVATVKASDPWAGKHIGIQLLSTTRFDLMGGYWDADHVRLIERPPAPLTLSGGVVTNGQFTFTVLGEPGTPFEILATTNLTASLAEWTSLGAFENATGRTVVTDTANMSHRYYCAQQL